jgi:hypothetical protein
VTLAQNLTTPSFWKGSVNDHDPLSVRAADGYVRQNILTDRSTEFQYLGCLQRIYIGDELFRTDIVLIRPQSRATTGPHGYNIKYLHHGDLVVLYTLMANS